MASATRRPLTVGIIGAGQLSRMLAEAAQSLGFRVCIFAQSPDDPAAKLSGISSDVAPLTDDTALERLLDRVDFVTFESELTPPSTIAAASRLVANQGDHRADIQPCPEVMLLCSDKLRQKDAILDAKIPTARFERFDPSKVSCVQWLQELVNRFPRGAVLKWARGGYDGRGTLVFRADSADIDRVQKFVDAAIDRGSDVYAEELVQFTYELAVVSTRARNGTFAQYPTVITTQKNGMCSEVRGPASKLGISTEISNRALEYARRLGEELKIVGTFAVEFFLTADDNVLVNEIAPRVHNSGHFTLEAAQTSQFENHWRAVVNQPLGSTETPPYFGMLNVVGPEGYDGPSPEFSLSGESTASYWYHKSISRPARKLGHVNTFAATYDQLKDRMSVAANAIAAWEKASRPKETNVQS